MANILVVLEKCPLSGKHADRRAGLETANHQRHLPENNRTNDLSNRQPSASSPEYNRTKRIDLSLITQSWRNYKDIRQSFLWPKYNKSF
jgi:hypothetical protein